MAPNTLFGQRIAKRSPRSPIPSAGVRTAATAKAGLDRSVRAGVYEIPKNPPNALHRDDTRMKTSGLFV
jgi:hypothetical protein